jgi:hypothetical protein
LLTVSIPPKQCFNREAMPEIMQTRAGSFPRFPDTDLPGKRSKDFTDALFLQPLAPGGHKKVRRGASGKELVAALGVFPQDGPRGWGHRNKP